MYEDDTNLVAGRDGANGGTGTSSEREDASASPKAASPCDCPHDTKALSQTC